MHWNFCCWSFIFVGFPVVRLLFVWKNASRVITTCVDWLRSLQMCCGGKKRNRFGSEQVCVWWSEGNTVWNWRSSIYFLLVDRKETAKHVCSGFSGKFWWHCAFSVRFNRRNWGRWVNCRTAILFLPTFPNQNFSFYEYFLKYNPCFVIIDVFYLRLVYTLLCI